jgi:hypothetical protein
LLVILDILLTGIAAALHLYIAAALWGGCAVLELFLFRVKHRSN